MLSSMGSQRYGWGGTGVWFVLWVLGRLDSGECILWARGCGRWLVCRSGCGAAMAGGLRGKKRPLPELLLPGLDGGRGHLSERGAILVSMAELEKLAYSVEQGSSMPVAAVAKGFGRLGRSGRERFMDCPVSPAR